MITAVTPQGTGKSAQPAPPILVLEDNEIDRYIIQKELGRAVLNPLHLTPDSRTVIDYLEGRGPYHDRAIHPFPVLLIADLRVWGHSGIDLLAWCRYDERPEVQQLPIVLLTAHADSEVRRQSQMFRADALLTKPLALGDLRSALEKISTLRLAQNDGHWTIYSAQQ